MSSGAVTPELAPEPPEDGDDILLSVRGLKKYFPVKLSGWQPPPPPALRSA